MIDDETFFAWLDGELDPRKTAEMDARVASDLELAGRAEQHRALAVRLRDTFDPVAAAPVPERFRSALRPKDNLVDLAAAKRRGAWPSLPQWAAVAATLAVGVLLGTLVPRDGGNPVQVRGGALYAAASLDRALDTELASAPTGKDRIGLTFRAQSGEICRTFTNPAASGLACRDGDRWRLRGLFAAPEGQAHDFRMAAGMDPSLAALIDSTMAGEPFDAARERAERDRHWR